MNITLIISSLRTGGAQRVLSELANYWVSKGHQVSLVTLDSRELRPFYPLDSKIKLIQLDETYVGPSLLVRFKKILQRIFSLRKTIRTLQPDVIISFIDVMNVVVLTASFGLKIPVIISERIDPHFHKIEKLYRFLRLKIYPFCSKLVVQTESSAQYFPKKFRRFIEIIPNPLITPSLKKENISEQVINIITIGRLERQKDHVTLIQAFYRVVKQYSNLRLTIYGEGTERKNIEFLVESLGLEGHVYCPGITADTNNPLINADLFVFPSLYEGFPNALCEAMAVGLPVIASNCSGNIDVIHDRVNARLFPVQNVDFLANLIVELLNDREQRIRLAEAAKEICERFHPLKIFSLWDQIIHDVVRN